MITAPTAPVISTIERPIVDAGSLLPRVTLVDINTVRAVRGIGAETVAAHVDCGRFRWVWDIGTNVRGNRRELRFLAAEIWQNDCPAIEAEAVWSALGSRMRQRIRISELEHRWVVSHQLLDSLCDVGELAASMESRVKWVSTRSACEFLTRRLVK